MSETDRKLDPARSIIQLGFNHDLTNESNLTSGVVFGSSAYIFWPTIHSKWFRLKAQVRFIGGVQPPKRTKAIVERESENRSK